MKVIRIVAWLAVAIVGIFILVNRYQSMQDANSGPGGPFVLTSHTGETVSNNDFKGRYMLIYFGYSFCPDVCPIELGKMSAAMTMLEGEGYDISPLQPIFISVDPERDTVEALADYVTDFHPSLVALTGSPEEIAAVAKEYRVYYKKREQEGLDSYLMDHQSVIFVMDPDGKYVRLFSSRNTPADIADALKPVLLKAN
ncbi:SCO family protein [Kordiimonas lacus]|uniref:Protein SCO1/2 n=1 Tax=Kordiimonas lacus TaxID=637679 RepID=A0A1G7EBV6_9PROT|nr:SCO family protein [Kordiimonas lacus]SDE61128.1 protein SCO1/2 [Kordiimonas lacus]